MRSFHQRRSMSVYALWVCVFVCAYVATGIERYTLFLVHDWMGSNARLCALVRVCVWLLAMLHIFNVYTTYTWARMWPARAPAHFGNSPHRCLCMHVYAAATRHWLSMQWIHALHECVSFLCIFLIVFIHAQQHNVSFIGCVSCAMENVMVTHIHISTHTHTGKICTNNRYDKDTHWKCHRGDHDEWCLLVCMRLLTGLMNFKGTKILSTVFFIHHTDFNACWKCTENLSAFGLVWHLVTGYG